MNKTHEYGSAGCRVKSGDRHLSKTPLVMISSRESCLVIGYYLK